MVLTLARRYRFEAARRLTGLGASHPCATLHGHGFEIELIVTGELDERTGLVMDYAEIDAAFAPLLERLDHAYLNDIAGLDNPTSELLAVWIWRHLADALPQLSAVHVMETPTSRASYHGEGVR